MTTPFPERAKLFIEQCAAIYRDTLLEYGTLASRVADEIDNADFGPKEWVKAATQFWDIAAFNGVDFAETVLAGPGASPAPAFAKSDVLKLPHDDGCPHALSVSTDFTLHGTSITVHRRRVLFIPGADEDANPSPLRLLPAGVCTFRVAIDTANLKGGTYVGCIRARPQTLPGPTAPKDQFVPAQVVW